MQRYKARFGKYVEDVEAGKAKIAAGGVAAAFHGEADEVSELQWTRMVEDLCMKGSLCNWIAVYDVSGSMDDTQWRCAVPWACSSRLVRRAWVPQSSAVVTVNHCAWFE
jgi:hypothetical protein